MPRSSGRPQALARQDLGRASLRPQRVFLPLEHHQASGLRLAAVNGCGAPPAVMPPIVAMAADGCHSSPAHGALPALRERVCSCVCWESQGSFPYLDRGEKVRVCLSNSLAVSSALGGNALLDWMAVASLAADEPPCPKPALLSSPAPQTHWELRGRLGLPWCRFCGCTDSATADFVYVFYGAHWNCVVLLQETFWFSHLVGVLRACLCAAPDHGASAACAGQGA